MNWQIVFVCVIFYYFLDSTISSVRKVNDPWVIVGSVVGLLCKWGGILAIVYAGGFFK
jgi:hypothetical protein